MLQRLTDAGLRGLGFVFPGASVQVTPAQLERTLLPGEQLRRTTTGAPGEQVAVVVRPGTTGRVVLFLYGNAMTLADTAGVRQVFGAQGAGVVCVDYVGYGLSDGVPGEAGCYRAAHAALEVAAELAGGVEQVDVVGWSMGSAVALELASRRPVRRLVLLSPMSGAGGYVLSPVGLHTTPLRRLGPFAGAGRVGSVRCPVLLIGGDADRLTPPWMAADLAAGLRRRGGEAVTETLTVAGAGHNDLFSHAEVWHRTLAFVA